MHRPPRQRRALAGHGEDMITHGAKDTTSACITDTACFEVMRKAMCSRIVTELLRLILVLNKRLEERAAPESDTDVARNHLHMYRRLYTDVSKKGNICVLCQGIAAGILRVVRFPRGG